MTRFERLGLVSLFVLATSARASPAHAQEPDPKPTFDEGRALVKDGLYAEALAKFEESYRVKPTPGALLNIADCYEKLGRYASAMEAFDRAIALSKEGGQTERAQVAEQRKLAIAPMVSILIVEATEKDVTVSIDGRAIAIGEPHPVDGGEHVLHVEAPCRVPRDVIVHVGLRADDQRVEVEPGAPSAGPGCTTPAPPPPVSEKQPAPPPAAAPASTSSTQRTLAFVAGGAGVVALGVGVGFGLSASSKHGVLEDACTAYPSGCPAARRAELDATYRDAQSAATISTVSLVSGVVLAGVAVALYFTAPSAKASTPARIGYAF